MSNANRKLEKVSISSSMLKDTGAIGKEQPIIINQRKSIIERRKIKIKKGE